MAINGKDNATTSFFFPSARVDAFLSIKLTSALNVMIRHGPALAFASKGQSFYPPPKDNDRPYELSGGCKYSPFLEADFTRLRSDFPHTNYLLLQI